MRSTTLKRLATGLFLVTGGLTSAAAFDKISTGIYRIDAAHADDLLTLKPGSEVNVLVLEEKIPKVLSDAHLNLTRKWVEAGGVLWVAGDGLEDALGQRVAPYKVDSYSYEKTSTGNKGGELLVKDASPRLQIGTHAITTGVTQLYVFPRYKFDGTLDAAPLVEMTDTRGKHGLILAAIPVGRGYLLLDGTAREDHGISGFKDDHPNSLKQGKSWSSYDWPMMLENVRSMAEEALQKTAN